MGIDVAICSRCRYVEPILFDDDIDGQPVLYAFLECTDDGSHVLLGFLASFLPVRDAMAVIDISLVSEIEQLRQMAVRQLCTAIAYIGPS